MIRPEYLCLRVCLNVLKHYSYHKRYHHKARRLDTRYDKPGGCTYEYRCACVNQLKNHIPAVKVTPTKPRGWIHDMISPEAARMRVNMYMQIYNECEKRTEKEETVSHTSRQHYIRSYQQRTAQRTQHANESKERKGKRTSCLPEYGQ